MIIFTIFQGQIAQKVFESKVEVRPVNALFIALKYRNLFATDADRLGCKLSRRLIKKHARDHFQYRARRLLNFKWLHTSDSEAAVLFEI